MLRKSETAVHGKCTVVSYLSDFLKRFSHNPTARNGVYVLKKERNAVADEADKTGSAVGALG